MMKSARNDITKDSRKKRWRIKHNEFKMTLTISGTAQLMFLSLSFAIFALLIVAILYSFVKVYRVVYLTVILLIQCGQGITDDELSPTCVSSLLGIQIQGVAAGLWHTVCISAGGDVYAFGGNQFGQLGTGADTAETLPRLLDAPSIENEHAKLVSCGARHSAVITDDGKVFCWGWNKMVSLAWVM